MKSQAQCYSIPAGKSFVNVLADWLLAEYAASGRLSSALVLLPTRRACRSLQEAFLARSGGKPLLLPRIQPIGEGDEDFTAAHAGLPLPAARQPVSPLCRQLLLTRLVHAFAAHKQPDGGPQEKARGYNLEQSAKLARQLARFLDDVAREELSMDRLSSLAEGDFATHWQQTLEFLTILSHGWPQILEEEGLCDIIPHRNRLLRAMSALWKEKPPSFPVIAAGSTGSQPAAAHLLATIAGLPEGKVILPALDNGMDEKEWQLLGPTHPQYALKELLSRIGCKREHVMTLDSPSIVSSGDARTACLKAVFQPPESTMYWPALSLPLAEGLAGIRLAEADTQFDEARMIAIALREALETPGKTAALITPDRVLARMVAAQMQRFGITMDDSAGRPLIDTPPAGFLRLSAAMVASAAAPSPLLSLLRHPLAAAGLAPSQCRLLSRRLELELLRGIRFTPGLEPLCHSAADSQLKQWLEAIARHAHAFTALMQSKKPVALRELLAVHLEFAQWLAGSDDTPGEQRLWAGEAGNALAAFLGQLHEHAHRLAPIDASTYSGLLDTLLADQVYRPRHGLHPRLHILGPMEARLQHFDLVILASLNEGTWPAQAEADPWMSRPMRSRFGLPLPEYAIGLAAHDMFQLCGAPEVLLTRAKKTEGTPTVPSRWLVRLHTLVAGLDKSCLERMQATAYYEQAKGILERPSKDMPPIEAPAPTPPFDARPRKMRVTAIDRWLRDPYVIYAQYILGLEKLPPLDEEPDGADFGTLVHKALEQFAKRWPSTLPPQPLDALLECGRGAFAEFLDHPALALLWWPRFENIASWIVEREQERRGQAIHILAESKGEWTFPVDGQPFTLTTSIDRIELQGDGSFTLVDYKTGGIPKKKDFERGIATQLPLGALVLMQGQMRQAVQPAPATLTAAEYWKLAGSAQQCEIECFSRHAKEGIAHWLAATQLSLENLIRRFDRADCPYTAQSNPSLMLGYNDYEHLTRRKEWGAA